MASYDAFVAYVEVYLGFKNGKNGLKSWGEYYLVTLEMLPICEYSDKIKGRFEKSYFLYYINILIILSPVFCGGFRINL